MAEKGLSRRRALGLAAGGAATVAVGAVGGAAPGAADDGMRGSGAVDQPLDLRGTPSRIVEPGSTAVSTTPLVAARSSAGPTPAPVSLAGFPEGVTLRPGDRVTVTDGVDGHALAAVPLCDWHDGVPGPASAGRYSIAGRVTVPAGQIPAGLRAELERAGTEGRGVSACLLDTDLGDAVVLAVRTGSAPSAPPRAG